MAEITGEGKEQWQERQGKYINNKETKLMQICYKMYVEDEKACKGNSNIP